MKKKLKILHACESYWPNNDGVSEVMKQLSERFASDGHDITVVTSWSNKRKINYVNGVKIHEFKLSGNYSNGFKGDIQSYHSYLMENKFDIIMTYAAQQWTTDLIFPILDQLDAKKILVPCGYSALNNPQYKEYFENLGYYLKKFDKCVYLSYYYQDIKFAQQLHLNNSIVIPNGADEREFLMDSDGSIRRRLNIAKNDLFLLSVGSHSGLKGHSELINAFMQSKIRNAVLLIIGPKILNRCYLKCHLSSKIMKINIFDKHSNRIIIQDMTREETVNAFKESDAFFFPSNIECSPIVLFEAMAGKTPFFSTDVGNAIEISHWFNNYGMILKTNKDQLGYSHVDLKDLICKIQFVANNREMIKKYGFLGHEIWKEKFSWQKIFEQYKKLYYKLVNST